MVVTPAPTGAHAALTQPERRDLWNQQYPHNTVVRYHPDRDSTGRYALGTTSGAAYLADGWAVVKLHELGKPVRLEELRPVPMGWCPTCHEAFETSTPRQLDSKMFWHHWDNHRAQAREELLAELARQRHDTGRWLARMLGRGWKIFADKPAAPTENRRTYWYAVPCPHNTPIPDALRHPGLLRHHDPYQLAKLGRAVNATNPQRHGTRKAA